MESSEIVDPRQPRTTKVKAKASTDASPASDQRSGNGAPRSDSGRGPWIRRPASAISTSFNTCLTATHEAFSGELPQFISLP